MTLHLKCLGLDLSRGVQTDALHDELHNLELHLLRVARFRSSMLCVCDISMHLCLKTRRIYSVNLSPKFGSLPSHSGEHETPLSFSPKANVQTGGVSLKGNA